MSVDYPEHLAFAKQIAIQAGDIMLKYFNQADISHYKGDDTIVTKADTEINQLLIEKVKSAYPDYGVFGEEESFAKDKDILWVCDPVDGTAMFARGVPVAVFSLALVVDGVPQLGVVYDPFTKSLYEAIKGQGAKCNGAPIQVSDIKIGDRREVSNFDLWPESGLMGELSPVITRLYDKSSYFVSVGSVIRACMLVATGAFVSAIFAGTKSKNVDIAAAKVIVEEAGGKVTDIYGQDQRYDQDIKGAVISNSVVHDEIIAVIKSVAKTQ